MLLDCYYINVKYYLVCVKLLKMPLNFVTVNDNVFQLLGDFVPTLLIGAPPWTPLGNFRPQIPSLVQF